MKSLTFPHALAYAFGVGAALLPIIQQFAPALVPGPAGLAAAGVAGALLAAGHQFYVSAAAEETSDGAPAAAIEAATKAVNAAAPPVVKALLIAAVLGGALGSGSMLTGCVTMPTAQQNAAVTAAVTIATGIAIQQKDTDPKVWQDRAKQIKLIALELQQVNDAGSVTLATLAADLQPELAKLGPADVLAVNSLVAALTPLLNDQISKSPKVGNTQVAVDIFLTAVLTTCAAYGV